VKHNIPLHVAIPSHKYRMRFIVAKTLLSVEETELTLEPMPIPKHAQQSTLEWVKNRNKLEFNHGS
jgi:hypothetical protein